MKHYKDKDNKVYAFESDAEKDRFAKVALVEITEAERDAILNPPLTPEQEMQTMVREATQVVNGMIQSVIDEYNEKHGLVFENVDSLAKYLNNPNYTHYQFCSDVIAWVTSEVIGVGIWETARDLQTKVLDGTMEAPDAETFASLLPAYSGYTGEPEVV